MSGQAQAYDASGRPLSDEQAAAAAATGGVYYEEGAQVHLVGPDGEGVIADASEVPKLIGGGYGLQSSETVAAEAQAKRAEEAKAGRNTGLSALVNPLKAAQFATLRGATFGLSDAVLQRGIAGVAGALGEKDADAKAAAELKALRDENATLSAVSEVGGAIGGAFMPAGGAGVVGRGLGALSAPGRAAAAVGERAVAAAGLGAASGLGGRLAAGALRAGTAGAIEGALQGAGNEFSKSVLENRELTAEKLVAGAGWGSLMGAGLGAGLGAAAVGAGDAASALARSVTGDDALREVLTRTAGERSYKAMTGNYIRAAREAERLGVDAARAGQRALDAGIPMTGRIDDAVEALAVQVGKAGDDMSAIARRVDDAGVRVDTETVAAKLREEASSLRGGSTSSQFESAARELEREADELVKRGEDANVFSWFHQNRRTIKELDKSSGVKQQVGKSKYRIFSEGIENALERTDPELLKAWRDSSDAYKDFAHLEKMAGQRKDSRATNRTFGLTDTIMGAAGTAPAVAAAVVTGNPLALLGMAAGPALATANKFAREQGSGYLALLADKLARFDSIGESSVRALVNGTTKRASKVAPHIGGAVVSGSDAGRRKGKAPEVVERVRAVAALTSDPNAMLERTAAATRGIAETHPDVAQAMGQQMDRAARFLQSKLPTPMQGPNAIQQQLETTTYTAQDLERFDRYMRAVDDPISVVRSLGTGRIDWEGIEAVKAVYPEVFADLQSKVVAMVAEKTAKGEPLPYGRRIRLGLAFDVPTDRTMEAGFVSAVQESWSATPEQGQPSAKPLPKNIGESTQTPSQKAMS